MTQLTEMGKRARVAARRLAIATTEEKNNALSAIARDLEDNYLRIIDANKIDIEAGENAGLSKALLDRLRLDEKRVADIADSIRELIDLADPVGRLLEQIERPNGLTINKVAVPIGVIGIIYEARPNVTADAATLCLKSGNAVILRGGKEAIHSNMIIAELMRSAISGSCLPPDCIQLISDTSRESANELMRLNGYVDMLIPRGGAGLIRNVVTNSTVPVIETGAGTCHIYVDKAADIDMAATIIFNAKTSRPSVCNACECMLIHQNIAAEALPAIAAELVKKGVEIRGDERTCAILANAVAATGDDWGREYGDYIIACRVVDNIEQAIEHIFDYGTGHSEAIITEDEQQAAKFMSQIDAAAVYHNASTRFTDGGCFGFGAEIGISTQKLHARGPLGLRELTAVKYLVYGDGQIR